MVEVVLRPRAKEVFESFCRRAAASKKDRMLMDAVLERAEWLKKNPHVDIRVPKKLIPKQYEGVRTLSLLKLPLFWRMAYTVRLDDDELILVLDILSHEEYDTLFGYRKK